MPVAKTTDTPSFCLLIICTRQTEDMGSIKIEKSERMAIALS